MSISFAEFDSIMWVVDTLIKSFSLITSYLTLSLNEIVEFLGLSIQIPSWIGGDMTPLALMVGVGLPTYLGYQFITWLLNVIT